MKSKVISSKRYFKAGHCEGRSPEAIWYQQAARLLRFARNDCMFSHLDSKIFLKYIHIILIIFVLDLLLLGCSRKEQSRPLVIWVTGGLQGNWLPQGEYGQVKSGGLLRSSRALELYRQPGNLLLDLGRFRYPESLVGENRSIRIRAHGFLSQLARLRYTALNVSLYDASPWLPELAARARELDLPLVSSNLGLTDPIFPAQREVHLTDGTVLIISAIAGGSNEFETWLREPMISDSTWAKPVLRLLLTDAKLEQIGEICQKHPDIRLVLWLNDGAPTATEIAGILVLGFGNKGNNLGRIELNNLDKIRPTLQNSDLTGWLDKKPYRHHPVRERIFSKWTIWRRQPSLQAFLWAISEEMSPQQEAQRQFEQTQEQDRRLSDLEDVHQDAPKEYAGPQRCLDCHKVEHPRDLAQFHQPRHPEAIATYPVYERCLPCHATGFDDPGGFLYPWERPELRWVSCEACHDASFQHALQGKPPYPRRPEEKLCSSCHDPNSLPTDHPEKQP